MEVNGADSKLCPLVYFGIDSFFYLTTIVRHFPSAFLFHKISPLSRSPKRATEWRWEVTNSSRHVKYKPRIIGTEH